MSEMITKNFSKEELSCKCCGVYGMKPIFVNKLQELRDMYGRPMILTSAYRCPKHNREVRGEKNSLHLQGLAVDVHVVDPMERYELIGCAYHLGFTGIGIDSAFIHLDYRTAIPVTWVYPSK